MTSRAHGVQVDQRRLAAYAWLGSAVVHAGAVALLSTVRLAPARLHDASSVRFFEVRLEQPAVRVAPMPRVVPSPRVALRPEVKPPPMARAAPRHVPRTIRQPRSPSVAPDLATPRLAPTPRAPAGPGHARPAASAGGNDRRPAGPSGGPQGHPKGGGGPVDLGSASPAGDVGGLGSGSTPVGSVPGTGTGSGSGTGPGSGAGPPGNDGPTGPEPTKQPAGAPGGQPPEPKTSHVSRVADRALPELVRRVNPQYPAAAAAESVEGMVRLVVTVGPDGDVEKVTVSKSSGDSRLDSAAAAAVKKWKYKPAVQDGTPRRVDTSATVTFRLN